ncbi:MAG: hypothetical protein L3J79_12760 [Candidatus Marinimicrobia bacterium]|nr:hypothetical protein [Candidatus Neomarinimicrobiota bacterium]
MKHIKWLMLALITFMFMVSCASRSGKYALPSATATEEPEWIKAKMTIRDTIFIVIHLPRAGKGEFDRSIQAAQSQLHTILTNEIEVILRDYWEQSELSRDDTVTFELIAELPLTLEHIMNHVTISDGWKQSEEVAILCALDYEEVAEVLMEDMDIKDRSFLSYFKRRMDSLAQTHR